MDPKVFTKFQIAISDLMDMADARGIYCPCGMVFIWNDDVNSIFANRDNVICPCCGANLKEI